MSVPRIPDSMKHLPRYRGLPVPYVAIWSSEEVGPGIEWSPQGIRPYANPEYLRFDPATHIWWLDTPDKRGHGIPRFGGTHSTRQRICMQHGKCQICGRRRRLDNKGPLLWVIPDAQDQRALHDEHGMFINPPTCETCFKAALTLCPHLAAHHASVRIFKGTPRVTGVHGTYVHPSNRAQQVYMHLNDPKTREALHFVMGRQYLITLEDEVEIGG